MAARNSVRFSSPVCVIPPVNSITAFRPGNRGENIDEALHGEEFLVGIECVELGFVGRVRRAGILLHVVLAILRRGIGKIGELRGDIRGESRHCFLELGAIVREIGPHRQAGSIGDNRDQVGAGHLLLDELQRGIVSARDVVSLHRRQIEEQDEHPAIADLVAYRFCRGRSVGAINRDDDGLCIVGLRRFHLFDILKSENRDFLSFAVLGDGELLGSESFDGLAGFVRDLDIDADKIRRCADSGRLIRGDFLRRGRGLRGCCRICG